uniref:DCC-interacting protein 13-alpha n=1 Tax=Petromyzon marinus TaxID=7757 RepID=A0AAJ7TQS3_PETMA|nr:DCC-interacting protein 13-alpha [Petromyzon marinus]
MPGMDKLPLEDALDDSPQTRSLMSVFEEDAVMFAEFANRLSGAMQRVHQAQNELSLATQMLSQQLLDYGKQRFPLAGDDEVMTSTLQQFAKVIDELSSQHAVLTTQMADAMIFPMKQFRDKNLAELLSLKQMMQISTSEHETAVTKYSRLSKRRESEKARHDATEEVYAFRRKQHQTSLQYCATLNAMQYRKKVVTLEPLLGYLQAQFGFFRMGSESLSQQLEEFIGNICASVQSVRKELDTEQESSDLRVKELLEACEHLYSPEPPPGGAMPDCTLTRKAGYLNLRHKTGLVSSAWERLYFFTQGGNLMSQARDAVAGGLVMDLDNSSVMAVDCEDRRFCFQISAFDGKKVVILQAESKKECEEWIVTISNISRQIYLTDNPQEVAARVHQSAMQSVTPTSSFQERHRSLRPRTSTSSPRSSVSDDAAQAATGGSGGGSSTNTPASTPAKTAMAAQASPHRATTLQLVVPGTPIQFDIISPATEEQEGRGGTGAGGTGGRRQNPFGEEGEEDQPGSEESQLLQQLYVVRFLGCMEVGADPGPDVIYETIRHVLTSRAIHSIFRMTESHLLVTCSQLRLIDPQSQVTRIGFPLRQVGSCAPHSENRRLFGFVLHTPTAVGPEGRTSLSCYVFESNNEGEKICDSIGLGKQISLHNTLERRAAECQLELQAQRERQELELNKQKAIEQDLEEQSRLIAASAKPSNEHATSGDGQTLRLSDDQSAMDKGVEPGKGTESEA